VGYTIVQEYKNKESNTGKLVWNINKYYVFGSKKGRIILWYDFKNDKSNYKWNTKLVNYLLFIIILFSVFHPMFELKENQYWREQQLTVRYSCQIWRFVYFGTSQNCISFLVIIFYKYFISYAIV